jgi:hypothetical protein
MATVSSVMNYLTEETRLASVDNKELMKGLKKMFRDYNFLIAMGVSGELQKVQQFFIQKKMVVFKTVNGRETSLPLVSLKHFVKEIKVEIRKAYEM